MSAFEVFKDNKGETRFRYRTDGGEIVFSSEGYAAKAAALKMIELIKRTVLAAPVTDVMQPSPGGQIEADEIAEILGISKTQLAASAGLSRESLLKSARIGSPKVQNRLREMLEIIDRVSGWAGGRYPALSWYRAQPIPAFGDRTAESLVQEGRAAEVRAYLDHIALGGFA